MLETKEFDKSLLNYKCDETVKRKYMSSTECNILCYYARAMNGNIVEIGCNEGLTTRDLALSNPDRTIYAVDYTGDDLPNEKQKVEQPAIIGRNVTGFKNVKIINSKSADVDASIFENVRFAFLDGDHTYEGIKADFNKMCGVISKDGVIIIHDYWLENESEWVGIRKFVKEIQHKYKMTHCKNTLLVVVEL